MMIVLEENLTTRLIWTPNLNLRWTPCGKPKKMGMAFGITTRKVLQLPTPVVCTGNLSTSWPNIRLEFRTFQYIVALNNLLSLFEYSQCRNGKQNFANGEWKPWTTRLCFLKMRIKEATLKIPQKKFMNFVKISGILKFMTSKSIFNLITFEINSNRCHFLFRKDTSIANKFGNNIYAAWCSKNNSTYYHPWIIHLKQRWNLMNILHPGPLVPLMEKFQKTKEWMASQPTRHLSFTESS